jgi:putative CocE/NonD family hydrolase
MRVLPAADGVRILRDIRIPMRDGVLLAADLYLPGTDPSGAAAFPETALPVVMDYIPYRKDEVDPAVMRHYLELPRHGYAVARVDIRGTGGSGGRVIDEYVEQEQVDGYDAIEWLAAQPWCDGHVNMLGISYGGFTALQVATLQPPHLTSIIPVDFTDDRYTDDCHYRGGLLRMYYDLAWYGSRMIAWNAMPPDPAGADAASHRLWREHIEENEPYFLAWLRHQVDGPYWRQGSVAAIADRIVCPAFLIGGWRDGYPNPPIRLFERLAGPKKLLIGPWDHRYPDVAIPGPRIDHLREVLRWLDYWCRGIDDGVMREPAIVAYMQEAGGLEPGRLDTPGRWRAEAAWPPADATERGFVLGAAGTLFPEIDGARVSGALDSDVVGGDTPSGWDRLTYDPTVGATGGLWSGGVPFGLPGDQRPDEAGSLVYTSAPLETSLSILGRPRAFITIRSSARVMGISVSLSDVAPDGASSLVAKGMLNGTRRESLTEPTSLVPGETIELPIEIDTTGWCFLEGHRIRLSIAAADWPNVWPTPEPGYVEVYNGQAPASRLVLPEVPDAGPLDAPAFVPSPVAVRHAAAADPPPTWTVARDLLTGRSTATIQVETVHRTPGGTRIERDLGCVCSVDPVDPAHVEAHGWHRCRSIHDGQTTEARADVVIRSSAETFDVAIDLEVTVDGVVEATRRWAESIPRHLL